VPPNGPALSCDDENFQYALNELSSRSIFLIPPELYTPCKLLPRPFRQLERLVRQPMKNKTCKLLKTNCDKSFTTITSKNKKYINAENFRSKQMRIETNMKNALLKTFEPRKALPTFLFLRLPNGSALSCGADNFRNSLNELSSC
jgi:hypothetical protein